MLLPRWLLFLIATFIFNLNIATIINAEGLTVQGINQTYIDEFEAKIKEVECKGGNFLLNIGNCMFTENTSNILIYLIILVIVAFIFYKLGQIKK